MEEVGAIKVHMKYKKHKQMKLYFNLWLIPFVWEEKFYIKNNYTL